jgi:glutamate decarboxylase
LSRQLSGSSAWNWRKQREAQGKDASRPNMVTGGNVQIV